VPEPLSQDMKELIQALNRRQAQYLVIGAHAVGDYAEPRSTKDLDVWVNPTQANAKRVLAALKEFGAPLFGTTAKTLTEKDNFLTIGVAPNRIDILKSIPGVQFSACWKNRRTFDIEGTTVNFLDLEDLIAAKSASKRPQDLADVEKLKKALELERSQRGLIPEPTTKPKRSRPPTRGRHNPDRGPELER
jgi:predicted nucleotidyltransferase